MSQAWFQPLRTDVFGSRPMRAVPISWIVLPGGLFSTNGLMSCAPAAASISAAAMDASFRIARSFSPKRQLILSTGMPYASVFVLSSSA